MNLEDIKLFSSNTDSKLFFDYDLKKLNWFNIGGKTKIFFQPNTLKDLMSFLKIYNKRSKIYLLGAGSNTLFSDKTYEGVTIKLGQNFNRISRLDKNLLVAGGGVSDKKLSIFSMENEISGLEFLSCIPGSVGGGIKMNSGCYDKEFKDILVSVQAMDYLGNIVKIPSNKIEFSYRSTDLPKDLIFISATLKGSSGFKNNIEKEILRLKQKKADTQPSKIKTGGSTFKNPIHQSNKKVWELIKQSVPKNLNFGDASISQNHANFFINKKNAKFDDMMALINYVKKNVKRKFNVDLELEIVVVD